MKKTVLQIILCLIITSCSSTKNLDDRKIDTQQEKPITYDYADKINSAKLNFIKKTYNWNNEKILIINYSQPINSCHFDNNKITSEGKKWWRDFYSKINTDDCLNINVLANGERVKRRIDNLNYFDDKYDFLLKNFFKRKSSCFGVLVLNDEGYYIQFNGHYSERQVSKYIENLKK
jgi:archaellum component FlaF (FlaF/FlaG flagellin family)